MKLIPTLALLLFTFVHIHAEDSILAVECKAIKQVKVEGIFGDSEQHRYFFAVKNVSAKPFIGQIKIELLGRDGNSIMDSKFALDLPTGQSAVNSIDARTGPPSVNGEEFGIASFSWSATRQVAEGRDKIPDEITR